MPLSRTLKLHCSSTPTSVWMRWCGKSYINTVRLPFCCVMSSAKQVPNNFVVVQLKLANPNSLPVWATALSGHLVQLSLIVSHEATESTRVLSLASLHYFFSCVILYTETNRTTAWQDINIHTTRCVTELQNCDETERDACVCCWMLANPAKLSAAGDMLHGVLGF